MRYILAVIILLSASVAEAQLFPIFPLFRENGQGPISRILFPPVEMQMQPQMQPQPPIQMQMQPQYNMQTQYYYRRPRLLRRIFGAQVVWQY